MRKKAVREREEEGEGGGGEIAIKRRIMWCVREYMSKEMYAASMFEGVCWRTFEGVVGIGHFFLFPFLLGRQGHAEVAIHHRGTISWGGWG